MVLGLPDGMLGPAWPAMWATFVAGLQILGPALTVLAVVLIVGNTLLARVAPVVPTPDQPDVPHYRHPTCLTTGHPTCLTTRAILSVLRVS